MDKRVLTKDDKNIDNAATEQFKLILYVIIGVLVLFLLFFVYNLIKCYLPKWQGTDSNYRDRDKEKIDSRDMERRGNKLEFEEM